MFKQVIVFIFICLCGLCAYGQTENYTAPVKWERYKIGEREVSVLFPKLPVVLESSSACSELVESKYAAYAGGIVYGLNITYKTIQKGVLSNCDEKRRFDAQSFEDRIKEIKYELKTSEAAAIRQNGFDAVKIKGNLFTYWFINDFANQRWFEIWISEENEAAPNVKNFVESFKIEKNAAGIEVGKGASRTLGDAGAASDDKSDSKKIDVVKTENEKLTPIRIILKPRARYTEAARQTQAQGVVRLRVSFLSSGGVGKIEPLSNLPYGLTEEAITAASKIFFVPANRNNVNHTVAKVVEYSFSIY